MSLNQFSTCKGFTLLEVMIAVLVLGIGLLGMAHLQITSLKQSQSAEFRNQASMLATNMLDMMRANRVAAEDNRYAVSTCPTNAPDNMAEQDIERLCQSLELIPQGDVKIGCNALDPDEAFICNVTISWTEVQEDGDLGTTSFIYSGAL